MAYEKWINALLSRKSTLSSTKNEISLRTDCNPIILHPNPNIIFDSDEAKNYVTKLLLPNPIKKKNKDGFTTIEELFASILIDAKITSENAIYFISLRDDNTLNLLRMENMEEKTIELYGDILDINLGCSLNEINSEDFSKSVQFKVVFKDGNYYIQPQDTLAKERMEISRTR